MKTTSLILASMALLFSIGCEKGEEGTSTKKDPGTGPIPYVYEDENGDIIPDFSCVGYHYGDEEVPYISKIAARVKAPTGGADATSLIQSAIDNAESGVVYLAAGTYYISGTIVIKKSGIVLRGEGDATKLIATGTDNEVQHNLIELGDLDGGGLYTDNAGAVEIDEDYVPLGRNYVKVTDASGFKVGDYIVIFRPATQEWISDLRMDVIPGEDTKQWTTAGYGISIERYITKIEGNNIFLDAPIVMALDKHYSTCTVMKAGYRSPRISESGVEDLYMESEYDKSNVYDENHCWNAIVVANAINCWVRNVTGVHFGHSTVGLNGGARSISVLDSKNLDPISIIDGSRRYSFAIYSRGGQLSLFKNCVSREGRHDFVTGSVVVGPNVYTKCSATGCHADTGPHQRWAMGILYDCVKTDGSINVQDRSSMGSGHGWAGANHVLWNCESKRCSCQTPWVSAKNWCIGYIGEKWVGNYKGRPNGEWYSKGTHVLVTLPSTRTTESLYEAQMKYTHEKTWPILKDYI